MHKTLIQSGLNGHKHPSASQSQNFFTEQSETKSKLCTKRQNKLRPSDFLPELTPVCTCVLPRNRPKTRRASRETCKRRPSEDLQQLGEHLHGELSAVCDPSTLKTHQLHRVATLEAPAPAAQAQHINMRFCIFSKRHNLNHLRLRGRAKCGAARLLRNVIRAEPSARQPNVTHPPQRLTNQPAV